MCALEGGRASSRLDSRRLEEPQQAADVWLGEYFVAAVALGNLRGRAGGGRSGVAVVDQIMGRRCGLA